MKTVWISVVGISLLVWAGCQEPLEPASSISKFRVLAVQADPPEVAPGDSVVHRVLFADPKGEGRDIYFIWVTLSGLLTPTSTPTEPPEVLYTYFGSLKDGADVYKIPQIPTDYLLKTKNDTDTVSSESTALSGDAGPSEDAGVSDTDAEPAEERLTRQATTILSACAGGETPDMAALAADLMNGSFALQNLSELCVGGEGVVTFKTFWVSRADKPDWNTNPTIASLTFNGSPLLPVDPKTGDIPGGPPLTPSSNASKCAAAGNCPVGDVSKANIFYCETTADCLEGMPIRAYLTDDSFEFYEDINFDGTEKKDEAPYISWFADGGSLSLTRSRTAEPPGPFKVDWSPPQKGGTFNLYVAVHDLRGGTSWQQYTIRAITGVSE